MVTRSRIDWTRRLAEAVTITLSILVAFGIDAWWDGVQERRADAASLESVRRELVTTRGLLDDAIRLHALTQTQARIVLEMTSAGEATVPPDSLNTLVISLWRSYIINPPTGALQAAVQSGAVARLEDEELKDRLLGWGGLLEDLLEEEMEGSRNAHDFFREFMASRVSLTELFSAYQQSVSGAVIASERPDLPTSRHLLDLGPLLDDRDFENQVLVLFAYGQASEDEARAFRDVLVRALTRLEATLGVS